MSEFIEQIHVINEPPILLILCGVFIFSDIITGYLKAVKSKKVNSSISRDGYIKIVSWFFALILSFIIDFIIKTNMFLLGSALMLLLQKQFL